jgi:hypothetical protein
MEVLEHQDRFLMIMPVVVLLVHQVAMVVMVALLLLIQQRAELAVVAVQPQELVQREQAVMADYMVVVEAVAVPVKMELQVVVLAVMEPMASAL